MLTDKHLPSPWCEPGLWSWNQQAGWHGLVVEQVKLSSPELAGAPQQNCVQGIYPGKAALG